ncbi:zinc-binding dehydrogenase [Leifsonia sp. 2MCAF36]|uniref:zinc-binding dehydrogenase n=1 Tax=Leifsonia sp. 2MCAF36 TaxID=3232988 RepID=UPI003F9645A8
MKAITIEEFGDPSGLRVFDAPVPVPTATQVLLQTEAIGVGGVDAVIRRGTLGRNFPVGMIPGSEVAGLVTAVGADVDPSWTGRRVWAFTGAGGGYAEHAVAEVDDLTPLPEGLTAADAVTLGSAGTVAHFALQHARFSAGEAVLVRGAAGSIGIAAVELAVQAAAGSVTVTTSSDERGRRLAELGATHILDRAGEGVPGAPTRFDVVIDIVGGPGVPAFIDRLAPNGRYVLVGAVAGFPPADFGTTLLRSFQESRSFATFSLATVPVGERNRVRAALFDAAAEGRITPVVHSVLPLERAREAHVEVDGGGVFGRIVLVPDVMLSGHVAADPVQL